MKNLSFGSIFFNVIASDVTIAGEFTASGVFADIIKASQENGKH